MERDRSIGMNKVVVGARGTGEVLSTSSCSLCSTAETSMNISSDGHAELREQELRDSIDAVLDTSFNLHTASNLSDTTVILSQNSSILDLTAETPMNISLDGHAEPKTQELRDSIAVVAGIEECSISISSSISSTIVIQSHNFNCEQKHPMWDANLVWVQSPLVAAATPFKLHKQLMNSENCGICCLLNLFSNIISLRIDEVTINKKLRELERQNNRNVDVSSILGRIHSGFFRCLFDRKKDVVQVTLIPIPYDRIRTWNDVIHHTMKTDAHILIVVGKHESVENELNHCIGIDLIHGLVYDSAEDVGVCTHLNVYQLQRYILPYIMSVTGFTLKGGALLEFSKFKFH